MVTEKQKYNGERRRIEQFINAAVIRLNIAARSKSVEPASRAATDLAQAVDELLTLMGAPARVRAVLPRRR
jgi:hypothetical protein